MWASRFNHWMRVSCVESRVWTSTLSILSLSSRYWLCILLFVVRYSSNPLIKRNHFGHIGSADPNFLFSLRKPVSAFTGSNEEQQARLIKGTASTLRELISDGRFESANRHLLENRNSFSEMLLTKMRRFYLTGTISSFVKLESVASSSPIWNGCFHYHTCSPCLFIDT